MANESVVTGSCRGDYLAHFRTKGSKNGVRRYQNLDGTWTELGKERRRTGDTPRSALDAIRGRRLANKKAKAEAELQNNAQKEERRRQELISKIRKHPTKIYKYREALTEDDVNELVQKINWDRKLKDIRNNEYVRGIETVRTIGSAIKAVKDLSDSSIGVYNIVALVNNTLVAAGKIKNGKIMKKVAWTKDEKKKAKQVENDDE